MHAEPAARCQPADRQQAGGRFVFGTAADLLRVWLLHCRTAGNGFSQCLLWRLLTDLSNVFLCKTGEKLAGLPISISLYLYTRLYCRAHHLFFIWAPRFAPLWVTPFGRPSEFLLQRLQQQVR